MARKKKKFISHSSIKYIILLLFATIFMGIGYASVNKNFVTISGGAHIISQPVIHISNAVYSSNSGADTEHSSINGYSATVLNSTVTLGSNSSSTITYSVTITNDTNDAYIFTGTSYSAPDFYDNTNINFQLSSLSVGDTVAPHASKTFNITFKYAGSNTSNPVLNSYISFDFDKYYTITYQNINTSGQNYPTYILDSETSKTITFSNDIPFDVSITPNVSYTYNNGVFTLSNVKTNITINRYYSITYNLDGGTNPANQPTKYLHGANVTILDATKANATFAGWYANSSFTGSVITNTNGQTGNLVLYAKWSGGASEPVPGSGAETIIELIENDPNSSNYIIEDDGTGDHNARYYINNPDNYVTIPVKSGNTNTNYTRWRILGVFNNVDDGTGNLETRIKVIRFNNGTKNYRKSIISWVNSQNDYLSDYFGTAVFHMGGITSTSQLATMTAADVYNAEQASNVTLTTTVATINLSDYAFAGYECVTANPFVPLTNYSTCGASTRNMLYRNVNPGQWFLNVSDANQTPATIFSTDRSGNVTSANGSPDSTKYYFIPAAYLKADVKIKSGSGTQNDPYILELPS